MLDSGVSDDDDKEEVEASVGGSDEKDVDELADAVCDESLSLTRGLDVGVRFGTAPPLSLSRLALIFFFFAEDVGLPKVCEDPDAVDPKNAAEVRPKNVLDLSSYLISAVASTTSNREWK